ILVMGGFTIVASMLLAYVLFASLVEERRSELGIARALGLTRGEVAAAMLLEASIYAGLAAVLGAAAGALLLRGLLVLINDQAARFQAPEFFLHFDPLTLPLAVAGGILLPLATIAAGTIRFARLDPSRAIRGAPEDVRVHRMATWAAGLALLAAGAAMAFDPLWRLAGVGVATGGVVTLLLASHRRLAAALAGAGGLAYTLWSLYSFDDFPREQAQLDPVLTMLRALVVTLLATALLAASPRPVRASTAAFMRLRPLRRGAYVALRYLAARRVPAGLTAAMVAVVAVIVTVMGTLAATFAGTLARDEGGFEVVGQSPFPLTTYPGALPAEEAAAIQSSHFVPEHRPLGGVRMAVDGQPFREGRFVRFAGVAPGFAAANGYEVADRDPRYASSRDAWEAVAQGAAVLAPPFYFEPGGLEVGATLQVQVGREDRSYVVAGVLPGVRRGNLFLAHDDVRGMGFPQTTTVLLDVAPGADASALAHRLTDRFQAQGLVFESVAEEVQEAQDLVAVTVMVMQAFLLLGLFVGITATGFLATRAVHERRREIGTLRALGYEAPDVSRAFVLESSLVSSLGLALGVGVGLVVAHAIWWRTVRTYGGAFVLPGGVLAAFAALVLALTALASWRPARQAARLDPSEALRYVE
ncbi:MAG TPA: ABC transporter permease, partial [Candidatus Thermoplasmatota archaeon]|nr:ABC transporter permease [Candidatus Thermoplasmatota archaeon]